MNGQICKMSWKDWSYTKKGAVVGGIIVFFGFWSFLIIDAMFISGHWSCTQFADNQTCSFSESLTWMGNWVVILIYTFIGILIGSFLGWIIGKVKSRKQT